MLAQDERELISERTNAGVAAAKRRGAKLGNPQLKTVRNSDTDSPKATKQQIAAEHNELLMELVAEIEPDTPISMATIAEALNTMGYITALGVNKSPSHKCIV